MTFQDIIRQGLGINAAQKALQWVGQNAPQVATPILRTEPAVQAVVQRAQNLYPTVSLPKIQAPSYLPSTVQWFANTANPVNVLSGLGESLSNAPKDYIGGITNLGLNIGKTMNNERVPLTSYVKNVAQIAEPILNVGLLGTGGGVAKNAIEAGLKPAASQTFRNLAGSILKGGANMALEGAKYGAGFGALSGIRQDVPNDTVASMLKRAATGAAQGAVGGAVAGPIVGGTLHVGGKLVGKALKFNNEVPNNQGGFIDPNAPLGEQYKAPYERGDIANLSKRLDAILGTESFMNGKWRSRLPARETAFKQLEYYAGQGDQGAIDALAQARAIEQDLINAQQGKAALTPEIKTVNGKTMKDMLKSKKTPSVEAPVAVPDVIKPVQPATVTDMIQKPAGPGPFPWEDAGYPGVKNPDAIPAGFTVNEKGSIVPKMNTTDVQQAADVAQLQAAGSKPRAMDVIKQYFGKLESAKTKGAVEGYKVRNLPKGVAPIDIIKAIENPSGNHAPEVQKYIAEYRKLDDQVFAEAKKAGADINYLRDHITHFWNNSTQEINDAYKRFTKSFSGKRKIPTYEEGIALGLKPRFTNPAQILAESVRQLERYKAGLEAFNALKEQGVLVPATVGSKQYGFEPINAPGFISNVTRVNDELAIKGNWYAPKEIASVINKAFSPAPDNGSIGRMLSFGSKLSSKIQDVTMSGGAPYTPGNAFTAANFIKEFTAGRIASPIKAFVTSVSDSGAKSFFVKNADQIVKMQERDVPINTNLNIADLAKGKTSLGSVWDAAVNDPTFKRFMPMLQINLFNDIEAQALKIGKAPGEAADIAAKAVKQFYGSGSIFTNVTRSQLTKDVAGTFLFAPKFRESMVNFWINNVKSLAHPLALENRTNVKFLGGAMLTLGAMNYLNQQFTGHSMMDNPPGTQDKLLIPIGKLTGNPKDDTVIGIPFLSSIATVPRALFTAGVDAAHGEFGKAAADIGQTGASMLIKPFADIANNSDFFGKPIYTDNMTPQEKIVAQGKYLFNQYVGAHPYVKELLTTSNQGDPAYQRISRAMELPLRFYTEATIKSKYYYAERDKAIHGLNPQEQDAFNSIPKADANDPNTRMLKYQIFLTYPSVFDAKQKIELQTAAQTGRPIDPLYLVNYDTAKKYMRYESLPEASPDRKAMTQAYPELVGLFKARSQFFADNPIEGQAQTQSQKPIASPEVQAAMDRKDWNYPGVKAYLNANAAWNDNQRAKLDLPPVSGGSSGYQSNKVSNFLKYDKYKWSNLKSKQSAAIKKSVKGIIKKRKSLSPGKQTKIKLPKIKTRKSILSMLKRQKTVNYNFG